MVSITASKCVSFHASKSPICQQAYLEEISRFSFEFLSNEHSVSYRDVSVLCTRQGKRGEKGKRSAIIERRGSWIVEIYVDSWPWLCSIGSVCLEWTS